MLWGNLEREGSMMYGLSFTAFEGVSLGMYVHGGIS